MFRFSKLLCIVFTLFLLPKANACEFSDVSFSADFVSGSLDSCHLNDSGEYVLTFCLRINPLIPVLGFTLVLPRSNLKVWPSCYASMAFRRAIYLSLVAIKSIGLICLLIQREMV